MGALPCIHSRRAVGRGRAAIDECRAPTLAHVPARVGLGEEVPARADGADDVECQRLIVHRDAAADPADQAQDLGVEKELLVRPDPAAGEQAHAQEHVRPADARGKGREAVLQAGSPIGHVRAGRERAHRERHLIALRQLPDANPKRTSSGPPPVYAPVRRSMAVCAAA